MAGNEIKFSLLLTAQEKVRGALGAAAAALDKVRASGEALKKTGENIRVARENVQAFADQGKQIITGLLEPVKAYESAFFDLSPAVARVTSDVSGSLGRLTTAANAWAGNHSRTSAEFLAVSGRQLEAWGNEEKAVKATEVALRAATGARSESVGTANTLNLLYQSLGDKTADWNTELGHLGDALVRTRQIYGSSFDAATLADPLKDVMQSARDAKVPAEQLLATIGALNQAGILGGAAGASAKNVIDGLLAAQGPLNFSVERTKDGQLDLARSLSSLRMQYGELSEMSPEMLGRFQEAFGPTWRDVSALLGQGRQLDENFRAIANSAGTAAKAQDAVDSSLTGRWAQLDNTLLELKVTIGEALIPAAKELAPTLREIVTPILDFVRQNPELVKTAATWFVMSTAASAVVSPVLGAAGAAASFGGNVLEAVGSTSKWVKESPKLVGMFKSIGSGTLSAAKSVGSLGGQLLSSGPAIMNAGRALVTNFVPATMQAVRASLQFAAALLTNPITWIVLAVVAAATLIYQNWEPISAFFVELWAEIAAAFGVAWAWLKGVWASVVPVVSQYWAPIGAFFSQLWAGVATVFGGVWDGIKFALVAVAATALAVWQPISSFFAGLFGEIKAAFDQGWVQGIMKVLETFNPVMWVIKGFGAVVTYLAGLSFFDAGSNIMTTLWNGMKAMASKPVEAMTEVVTRIRRLLPFSPAKDGPLRDIHKVKLVETLASAVKPAPLVNAMRATAAAGMAAFSSVPTPELAPLPMSAALASGGRGGASGAQGGVQIGAVTIQIGGNPERSLVAELEAWISNPDNGERLATAIARHQVRAARSEFA